MRNLKQSCDDERYTGHNEFAGAKALKPRQQIVFSFQYTGLFRYRLQ
jgi:hypothetical protein